MDNNIIVSVISDIHFGSMDSKILLNELAIEFLDKIEELPKLDMVIIDGDLYDHKLSLNSNHAKACFLFISKLCKIVKDKNACLRIVKGTLSHDNDQLDNLQMFKDICDFKIFVVMSEEVYRGNRILYIPEEYIDNYKEYTESIYKNEYDLIFGHGMVKEASFTAHKQESGITMKRSPIFDTTALIGSVKGICMFGHIHTPMIIKERFYYCGSFTRWCFGEEEDKGFNIIYYNRDMPDDVRVVFMKNNISRILDTVTIDVSNPNIIQVIDMIRNTIDMTSYDKKRIMVNISDDIENPKLMNNMIMESFSKFDKIKIIVNSLAKEKTRRVSDEKIERLLDEYGFIFDSGISKEEKIHMYINKKYQRNIPLDKLKDYIFNKITD